MVLPRTPIRCMLPRSETLLSPPPLKRARVEENRELLLDASVTQMPASLFLPGNLDDNIFSMPDLLQEDVIPRISLKPRTSLSTPADAALPDVLPLLKRRASSDVLVILPLSEIKSLGVNVNNSEVHTPRRRMKRRRSSMSSSCGADSAFHLHVTPMTAMF